MTTTETRYKLLIMFLTPEDPAEFERRWAEEFVPLAERLPGLRRVVVGRTHGGPAGPVAVHLVHELHFDDFEALRAAMRSEAGVAAGQCLVKMAGKRVTLAFAEHMEDSPASPQRHEEVKRHEENLSHEPYKGTLL